MTREKLIETLSDIRAEYNCFDPMEQQQYHALSEAIEALTERKTGKWMIIDPQRQEDIDNDNYMYTCTCCLHNDLHARSQVVSYCWWCGAKMEVEE